MSNVKVCRLALAVLVILFFPWHAHAQGIGRMAGIWNNDATGENIIITPDPVGGWQFWSSDFGQARITSASFEGANIKVEGREGLLCFYIATLTAGNRMNWQLRSGNRSCLSRIFTRAE
jgi:hypothetical protein